MRDAVRLREFEKLPKLLCIFCNKYEDFDNVAKKLHIYSVSVTLHTHEDDICYCYFSTAKHLELQFFYIKEAYKVRDNIYGVPCLVVAFLFIRPKPLLAVFTICSPDGPCELPSPYMIPALLATPTSLRLSGPPPLLSSPPPPPPPRPTSKRDSGWCDTVMDVAG